MGSPARTRAYAKPGTVSRSCVSRILCWPAAQERMVVSGVARRAASCTRTTSTPGSRRSRPRRMSPSKFSSLTSLITEQSPRLGAGHDELAEILAWRLGRLDIPAERLRLDVTLAQVGF